MILFSRNMKIVGYGDEETRQILEASTEETVVFISSKAVAEGELGKVVELMEGSAAGLTRYEEGMNAMVVCKKGISRDRLWPAWFRP